MYILNIIRSIYVILNREQKQKMLLLQIFFAVSAIVQVVGVASIAPFIGVLSNPDSINTNWLLARLYKLGNFHSTESFIFGFALLSIGMIFISNGISAITLWLQLKFSIYLGSSFQSQLFNNFIQRDYLFHKSTNYNQHIAIISNEAPRFIYMVLQPYLTICSQAFVAIIIFAGLLYLDPLIALGSVIIIGGSYLATYWAIKKSLKHHGDIVTARSRIVQALLSETFIGIKDIKLNALEARYSDTYQSINRRGLDSSAYIVLTGDLPRFVIETVSFSAILFFALYLLSSDANSANVVSLLSIYALAGYKLLPTMQQIYKSISSISANGGVVFDVKDILDVQTKLHESQSNQHLPEINDITLNNISYQYPRTQKMALNNISVRFEKEKLNTIAGPSGSGKSTLADIILGLLPPQNGSLEINGSTIQGKDIFSYQRCIGYVPQNIFILDDSVIANIAFGVSTENIDLASIKRALIQANAMEFVEKLSQGMATRLGQDGKLLSGGQRQRIGIARALYRNNKVLVLDEPTSALDIESEHDLMCLLNELKKEILIIVISHRPAAIKLSDKITVIVEGEIMADGSYSSLYANNNYFKAMIEKGFLNDAT